MTGVLLGKGSPLAAGAQQGLMNDLVRQAQGDFIAGAADYTSTVLQSTGDAMTTAGYVMMASGIGAPIGEPMAKVGNLMKTAGTAIEIGIDWVQGNRARAGYTKTEHIHNYPLVTRSLILYSIPADMQKHIFTLITVTEIPFINNMIPGAQ